MIRPAILLFGERCALRKKIVRSLASEDIGLIVQEGVQGIRSLIHRHRPSLVLCIASGGSPTECRHLLTTIRAIDAALPVILLTAHSSEALAIAALRAGASDYYKSPYSERQLLARCRELMRRHADGGGAEAGPPLSSLSSAMVGKSSAMGDIRAYIQKVAATDSTVLITGETGTGKELATELIHARSRRRTKPLIRVNCAAIPEGLIESELFGYERGAFTGAVAAKVGKFEMADGGSLFLDEIGEMQPYAQAKILHCIESKAVNPLGGKATLPVNIRVIAATNRGPEALIAEGRFREDLYYRLNVARLHLPPLRDRREDIPGLIDFGIRKLNRRFKCHVRGLKDEVVRLLLRYDWPGNVRELMNVLEGTFINMPDSRIAYADLPVYFKRKLAESQHLPSEERNRILEALLATNWNKSTAAAKLNWSRMTLYRKMTKYHIVENRNPRR